MNLSEIRPAKGAKKGAKRVGRGIGCGKGKTCGRGHKGQTSRSGYSRKQGFEGGQMPLQRRVPKFGFSSRIGAVTTEIRLSELQKLSVDVVDLETLHKENLINANIKRAKVILSGEISRPITIKGLKVTKGARSAIEAAGGKVE